MTTKAWITLAALASIAMTSRVASAKSHHVEMQSTGVDADARGRATFRMTSTLNGRLDLRVKMLEPSATYDVVVNGVKVGTVTTRQNGGASVHFRSRPHAPHDQFLGFDPRGAVVLLRNTAGEDLLTANIGPDADADQKVICCTPGYYTGTCEDRTAAECAADGGTVSTATSCLPNPCVQDAHVEHSLCCIPDDNGPECEDRSSAECAAEGGIVVAGSSCTPNPCVAVVPADPDTRCCLGDDAGAECEDRRPAECAALGGVDIGPGVCSPTACEGVTPPVSGSPSVRVRCEVRPGKRSKISVDGSGLAAGDYTARVVSADNTASSVAETATLAQVEFDFSSEASAGATVIPVAFLQGSPAQVLGQIIDAGGNVVVEGSATCDVK